jgi:hypothetical protein
VPQRSENVSIPPDFARVLRRKEKDSVSLAVLVFRGDYLLILALCIDRVADRLNRSHSEVL